MNDAATWFTITVTITLVTIIGTLLHEAIQDRKNK